MALQRSLSLTAFTFLCVITGLALAADTPAAKDRSQATGATPAERIHTLKGFAVELLYSVPRNQQGSWVSMTTEPKGRLIVSDQYGKLFRVSPPKVGGPASDIRIEPIDVEIGMAQGLLWAFDSLYVVVNGEGSRNPNIQSGLYRVRDTDGDDKLDKVERLRRLNGGGEHGPHGVILSPDGKSIYVVAGNATQLTELAGSRVPRDWGEDNLLPRMVDGNGFMTQEKAPGGCIYRVDPDGKSWELVSMGYRNPYDVAFNQAGELFTYDSDMEWDMNTPWYRPTRVCQAVSGSDFGYRNGAGKWPPYYLDSLPPVVNVGPGSPTGITFGYGARFPAKYQDALYLCDWSYGKLYAVHLKPDGASSTGELEEFVTGAPLPLTDIVVNPKDGALYFTIGGRRTTSGLYRVTYAGPESTSPAPRNPAGSEARALRHSLEAFHGHQDPQAVEQAWPQLGHPDRFVRWAARVAIEFQDPATWRDKALAEKPPQSALPALLALVHVSAHDPAHRRHSDPAPDPALAARIQQALDRLPWNALSLDQKIDLVRVEQVLLNRFGKPDTSTIDRLIQRFDPHFPAGLQALDFELCELLVFLQSPTAARKCMDLLSRAPTQEEQMEYAASLRNLRAGWTPELRKAYFSWFTKAAAFRGGASFTGFLNNIKRDAVATLSDSEKGNLKALIEKPITRQAPSASLSPRPFVKNWTLDELAPLVEKNLRGRSFEHGRELFGAASCFSCHRFSNEGGAAGPDLTGAAGRFNPRDLLESIIQPSKVISDQYAAVDIATSDGRVITGRIVNLHGEIMSVNTNMLDPNALVNVDRRTVEAMKASPVSMMPEGLLNTFTKEEILDLMAYLLSRGDRNAQVFH